ncbi:MAG: hypothetical protein ABR606_20940 [Vicinamibacterales bacterium]
MDTGLVRKRLRSAVDAARREATARRSRADASAKAYEQFLVDVAVPAFRAMATALRAEGLPFEVMTPSDAVRLVPERNRDDGITLELDATADPPMPLVSVTRSRGSRVVQRERTVRELTPAEELTDEDVITMLLEELKPWMA